MRAEDDYRKGRATHNRAQGFQAVHARHFEVEGDDVRLEFGDFAQGEGAVHGDADDHDEIPFLLCVVRDFDRMNAIELVEADECQDLIAQAEDFALVHFVNFLILDAADFDDGRKWNGEEAAPDAEEQRLNAGQREGHPKLDSCALAFTGSDVNRAFEAIENGADDVHADAAAGDFGDFAGGAEPRLEDQVHDVLIGEASGVFEFDEAVANGVFANIVQVDAAAIVADFDDDLRALMMSVEGNCSAGGLAGAEALVSWLNTVVDGVADKVRERLGKRVEDAFVEIGVFAGDFQGDVFAAEFRDVANDPRKSAEELFDGNHADFEDALVKFVEDARLECQCLGELAADWIAGVAAVELGERAVKH